MYDGAREIAMPTPTIIEEYVIAAMKRVQYEEFEEGGMCASVPDCFAVFGVGPDIHQSSIDLYARLQEWVHLWLTKRIELPVLDGIDLNAQRVAALKTYAGPPVEPAGTFYEDEEALEAAFAKHDETRGDSGTMDRRRSRASRSSAK